MMFKVRFKRPFRGWKGGDIAEVTRGVADMWVNRRKIAEDVDGALARSMNPVQTMVPAVPGLKQMVEAVTGRKRKTA